MIRPADPVAVPPFVLVAGAASRDITASDPRGWRLGGAVTYGGLTLARLGMRVGVVVGVDAEAATARELEDLEEAGAIVIRVPLRSGPVFEITESPAAGRRLHCRSGSDPLPVFSVPRAWLFERTPGFLGPVAGELGAEWSAVGGDELALGWQGLLREVRAGEDVRRVAPRPHPLLDVATLVGLSREDVAADVTAGELARFLRPGGTLVRTDADRGGDVLTINEAQGVDTSHYTAVPSDRIVDTTGAGDVFLAAMLAARLDRSLGPDVAVAAAAASLVIEEPGVEGVPTRNAVVERMRRAESLANRWASDDSSRASGRPSHA